MVVYKGEVVGTGWDYGECMSPQRMHKQRSGLLRGLTVHTSSTISISLASEVLEVRDVVSHPLPRPRVWPRWKWDGDPGLLFFGNLF